MVWIFDAPPGDLSMMERSCNGKTGKSASYVFFINKNKHRNPPNSWWLSTITNLGSEISLPRASSQNSTFLSLDNTFSVKISKALPRSWNQILILHWPCKVSQSESVSRSVMCNTLGPHGLYVACVLGISRARMLEWVASPFSRSRDGTWVSCIAGRLLTVWSTKGSPKPVKAGPRTTAQAIVLVWGEGRRAYNWSLQETSFPDRCYKISSSLEQLASCWPAVGWAAPRSPCGRNWRKLCGVDLHPLPRLLPHPSPWVFLDGAPCALVVVNFAMRVL